MSIGINTNTDIRVATLHSRLNNVDISFEIGENYINCNTERFYLSSGVYNIDVKIFSRDRTIIWAPNMYSFTVNTTDFFGSGKMPEQSWGGLILVKSTWGINGKS